MAKLRFCLTVLILMLLVQPLMAEEAAGAPKEPPETIDKQLKINRDALLTGKKEETRVDAATVMLLSEDPQARKVLLEVMGNDQNHQAQKAVCLALSQNRDSEEIKSKEDFIKPLIDILKSVENQELVQAAGEAALVFDYEIIGRELENIAFDSALSVQARKNAVGALKVQPDMKAVLTLIALVEDPEQEVAETAKNTLKNLGLPVGESPQDRRRIIRELKKKGRKEFLADWKARQETEKRISDLSRQRDHWKELYLTSLERIYTNIDDNQKAGEFLGQHLQSSEPEVKLWALKKVSQWIKGTRPQLPDLIEPLLIERISDENKQVRLKTANLLSLMTQLNSAQSLLEQIKQETDQEVKDEMFTALGGACYYAFLPRSDIDLAPHIRLETLELSQNYLASPDPNRAIRGAEVIRKLLEQNGLSEQRVESYLQRLAERYQQHNSDNIKLRGELLDAMADLCGQSVYSAQASRIYRPVFQQALLHDNERIRLAAVNGLISISETEALTELRHELINDENLQIRQRLINLASELGGPEDLNWLAEKTANVSESDSASKAMLQIFGRSEPKVLYKWAEIIQDPNSRVKLSNEQLISFYGTVETRAAQHNEQSHQKNLRDVRENLVKLYLEVPDYEQAAKYLGILRENAETRQKKEELLGQLLEVYLRWPKADAAKELIKNQLVQKDLDVEDTLIAIVNDFIANPPDSADPNRILAEIIRINPENRPVWKKQIEQWKSRLGAGSQEPRTDKD